MAFTKRQIQTKLNELSLDANWASSYDLEEKDKEIIDEHSYWSKAGRDCPDAFITG